MAKRKKKDDAGFVFPRPSKEERVVVCFKKQAGIRLSGADVTSATGVDVSNVQDILKKHTGISIARTFDQTEDVLDMQTSTLAGATNAHVPTLSGFYNITTKDEQQAKAVVADLEKSDLVEEVYIEPPAVPALFDTPDPVSANEVAVPATPVFNHLQGYLDPAPDGIDAKYAWTFGGGKGQGVGVIDIEGAWNFTHEDLLLTQGGVVGGTPSGNLGWINHGTAVHGEIGGDHNNFGILGISPSSKFSAVSIFGTGNSTAKALKAAADKLNKGDIILIELHRPGPNATGQGQFGYIAIEWWSADFAAVQYATAKGIIVVAAAGNGFQNLDDAAYQGKFDRTQRDSGAILVGAGAPPSGVYGPDRSRLDFSNYGKIVDVQGWGREVTTTGYGNLQGGSDQNRWYTKTFSGTSSASPIIVGACACLQGIRKANGAQPLSFAQLRNILRTTGSPQTSAPGRPKTQRIGNRPDLKAAIPMIVQQQINSGIATKYWLELAAYPSGSTRSLWLYVNNAWSKRDNPSASIQDAVQRAFLGTGSNVRVWYNNGAIVGLVVEGN